jgi:protein tyrosine phosphatase (PTP) superfamily phosphohydrolase (DUF442 family)
MTYYEKSYQEVHQSGTFVLDGYRFSTALQLTSAPVLTHCATGVRCVH